MRFLAIVALAIACAGCAAGGALEYLRTEYGGQEKDGWVDIGTPDREQIFNIWIHKSKPKLNVQTSLRTAADTGISMGATYGAVSAAPVQPLFQTAALKFLHENKGPSCTVSNPNKIHEVVWEFDYDCDPKNTAPRNKQRKRG